MQTGSIVVAVWDSAEMILECGSVSCYVSLMHRVFSFCRNKLLFLSLYGRIQCFHTPFLKVSFPVR